MSGSTHQLIAQLANDLQPVGRLRPPMLRALLWLSVVSLVAAAAVLMFSPAPRTPTYRATDMEFVGMLLTTLLAAVASFQLSIPGYSRVWAWIPLPAFALWILSSGHSCYRIWLLRGADPAALAESPHCFAFLVITSAPLTLFLFWMLRRARPLNPVPVAAMGALAVSAFAAFILQFFHPFNVTFIDLAFHLAGIGVVVAVSSAFSRKFLHTDP